VPEGATILDRIDENVNATPLAGRIVREAVFPDCQNAISRIAVNQLEFALATIEVAASGGVPCAESSGSACGLIAFITAPG
jgi:hypothetical protein